MAPVTLAAGSGANAYAQIGNGGFDINGSNGSSIDGFTIGGDISVSDLALTGGNTGANSFAQVGNGDASNTGFANVSGDITIDANGKIVFTDGKGANSPALIGNAIGTGTVTGAVTGYQAPADRSAESCRHRRRRNHNRRQQSLQPHRHDGHSGARARRRRAGRARACGTDGDKRARSARRSGGRECRRSYRLRHADPHRCDFARASRSRRSAACCWAGLCREFPATAGKKSARRSFRRSGILKLGQRGALAMTARHIIWALGAAILTVRRRTRRGHRAFRWGRTWRARVARSRPCRARMRQKISPAAATADAGTAVIARFAAGAACGRPPHARPRSLAARKGRTRIRCERLRRRAMAGQRQRAFHLHGAQHKLAADRHRDGSRTFALQRARSCPRCTRCSKLPCRRCPARTVPQAGMRPHSAGKVPAGRSQSRDSRFRRLQASRRAGPALQRRRQLSRRPKPPIATRSTIETRLFGPDSVCGRRRRSPNSRCRSAIRAASTKPPRCSSARRRSSRLRQRGRARPARVLSGARRRQPAQFRPTR